MKMDKGREEVLKKTQSATGGSKEIICSYYVCKGNEKSNYPVPKCRGLRPAVGTVERDLWCWYNARSTTVPKNLIQMRARWMFQQAGIQNFKASDGWFRRWFKRWRKFSKASDGALHVANSLDLSPNDKDNSGEKNELCQNVSHSTSEQASTSCVTPLNDMDNIVTPSLGDTLDCSFTCLKSTHISVPQGEKDLHSFEDKSDAKLSSLIHDTSEQHSRTSKSRRLKDNEQTAKFSYVSEFPKKRGEKSRLEGRHNFSNPGNTPRKKRKRSSSHSKAEDLRTKKQEHVHHIGKRYHPQFKERVLSYLKSHTFKETARKFGVHQGSISTWQKDKLRSKLTEEGAAEVNRIRPTPAPVDAQFLSWLRRERGHALSAAEVHSYARRLVTLAGGVPVVERQVQWFALWVSRFGEKFYVEGMEDDEKCQSKCLHERRMQYPAPFRREVAAYAAQHSQMAAVRTFNVSRKRVFEWLRASQDNSVAEESSTVSDHEIQRHGSGRAVSDSEIDKQIWQWYCDSQNQEQGNGRRPTSHEVRAHAAALYATRGLSTPIQCSYGWFRRWCERFGVRLRYSTDDELLAWALAQLDGNHALSHAHLQEQARQLWQTQRPDFKASPGWAIRFCKRHPNLLQTVPTVTTPLPEPLKPLVVQFRSALRELVRDNALSPNAIGNMDELPLGFSAPPAGTPKRQLLLRKPGMDSCHATVVLSCLADGTLLPTMLILKDEVQLSKTDTNLIVVQQDNGLMDLACMQKWLDVVWFPHALDPSLLVADSFGPHCASEVASDFMKDSNKKQLLKLIPAGCSSKLQPLDVSVKRTFQQYLDHCWERLNIRSGIGWTCGQQLRLPSATELIKWVADAHQFVMTSRQETIRRSFLVTGLLVADNHSEDHFIENPAALPSEEDPPEL